MSRERRGLVTIAVVLLILQAPAVYALAGPSHDATAGTTYQTNSGLEVTLGDDREIEATPFDDDATFATEGVQISALDTASVTVDETTFGGDAMAVSNVDATTADVTLSRADLTNDLTINGSASNVILRNVTLDDGNPDIDIAANTETTLVVENVPDVDGIQAVDQDGTVVAGTTDTSDNTAELTIPTGTHALRLQNGPSTLEVRDLVSKDLVQNSTDPITIEVEFFGDEGSVAQRSTTDGTIDMGGLPADERFSVTVDAGSEYVQRQVIIPSLLEQQTAWLLPASTDIETVEPRFTLEDPSSQFDTEESEIVLERPIDRGNGTEFVAVAGDRVGLNGFDTILERDQRYRVTVTDPDSGATRQLGEFTPTQSEPVTLQVQDVEFDSDGGDVEGLAWTARYITNDDSADEVEFIFRDEREIQTLEYTIHERGNESNVLTSGTASGNVTVREPVPPGEDTTVWTVSWDLTRGDASQEQATRPVSDDDLPVGPAAFPQQWQTIAAMLFLFAVAGLFGAANPGVGGIAVAGTGGLFFMIGWLPDGTGGLMVLLALFIAVLSYVGRKARGATA